MANELLKTEMRIANKFHTPYFEGGRCFEADVLFDRGRNAIAFLTGELAVTTASGEPLFLPMRGGLVDTVMDMYKANTGKNISFIDRSDREPRPYRDEDIKDWDQRGGVEILTASYYAQHVYTFRGELHDW